MQRLTSHLLSSLVALAVASTSLASNVIPPAIPISAPTLPVKSYVLMSSDNGHLIAASNPHKRLAPASLTKLMTLYVTFNALKTGQVHLSDFVPVSNRAWHTGGSRMFLQPGKKVSLNQLITGITVDSGNDACIAIAEYIAGSETAFVAQMNNAAQGLGLKDTHYSNANGLPRNNHYSSAYDLAKLASAIRHQFPEYQHFFARKWFRYNNIKQANRNRLLWRDGRVTGMKTGHTNAAGYCLVASASDKGFNLISVIMGAKSDAARANTSQQLLNYGFRFYEQRTLFKADTPLAQVRTWQASEKTTPIGVTAPLTVTIPRGSADTLQAQIMLKKTKIIAPIQQGETLGNVIVTDRGKEIAEEPLIALKNNPLGNWWQRAKDKISAMFHH